MPTNAATTEQEPGGPDTCVCPDCEYEADKERGTPCRSMECPECGASLVAGDEQQEADTMPITDIGQIAQSAIETALAVINETGEVSKERAVKMLHALEADLTEVWQPGARAAIGDIIEAKTKTVDGKNRPAGDFLVVEDKDKPATWHLPVKVNGKPDHDLMGAAKAALTSPGGHRGNQYEGPNKESAIKKLKALYKAEDMEWSAAATEEMSDVMIQAENDVLLETLADIDALRERVAKRVGGHLGELHADGIAVGVARDATEADLSEVEAAIETGRRAPVVVDFQILQPGPGNKKDNRYYPQPVVERDIHVFEGADVFATDHKEEERSERTKVGKVLACPTRFTENKAPVSQVLIYDPHQAEKTRNRADAGELGTLECSIYGKGTAKPGEVDGKKYSIVESITEGKYLELVSKAGAGGRALNLAENIDGGETMNEQDEKPEPAPVEEVEIVEGEAEQGAEEETPSMLESEAVEAALAETNLPEFAKASLQAGQYADADVLKEAIDGAVAEVKKLTGSGQVVGLGESEAPEAETLTVEEREQRSKDAFNNIMREVGLEEV